MTESADTSLTTSTPANQHLTNNTDVTQTATTAADVTHNPSDVYVTAGQNVTSYTNYTRTAVTSSPATHADPYKSDNSSDHQTNQTQASSTSPFPDHSASGNLSTTYGATVFNSTEGMRNESAIHTVHPDVSPSTSPESSTLGGFTVDSNSTDVTSTLVTVNVEVKKGNKNTHIHLQILNDYDSHGITSCMSLSRIPNCPFVCDLFRYSRAFLGSTQSAQFRRWG